MKIRWRVIDLLSGEYAAAHDEGRLMAVLICPGREEDLLFQEVVVLEQWNEHLGVWVEIEITR